MAAKVAMVAVPTVLGIASIRVYRVSDAPAGGLAPREELNVYNPLPKSAQVHFVPDTPGVTESVFTATRERVLPVVHAVKGACVSVKRGSVNLYHAGEDVFYYLKDPPPGFLPRFGTITMAGLLGMFLARKGSRLKRVSLPLGLMSAGASVCFPAQAVSVLKVAGKKVYAAAHWSSAAVSSLLTSKPQERLPQTQAAAVPHPEEEAPSAHSLSSEPGSTTAGSAQSAAVSQTPVESAAAISDEPVIAVITEEASVTLSESSGVQAPTETHQDPVAEPTPPTEEFPVSKETSDDISVETADPRPTASLEEAACAEVPAPTSTQESTGPAVESVVSDPQPAAVQEERSPTHSPPPSEQPAVGSSKGGATFQPDPAHMDFGQSNPEDEDMYSTRS